MAAAERRAFWLATLPLVGAVAVQQANIYVNFMYLDHRTAVALLGYAEQCAAVVRALTVGAAFVIPGAGLGARGGGEPQQPRPDSMRPDIR